MWVQPQGESRGCGLPPLSSRTRLPRGPQAYVQAWLEAEAEEMAQSPQSITSSHERLGSAMWQDIQTAMGLSFQLAERVG